MDKNNAIKLSAFVLLIVGTIGLLVNEFVADIIEDDEVRVMIITGNGRTFCAGTDVSALGRDEQEAGAERQRRLKG